MKFFGMILAMSISMVSTATLADDRLPAPPQFDLIEPEMTIPSPPSDLGALVFPMEANDIAPFSGVLINSEGLAWIMTQFVYAQRFLLLEMDRRVSATRLWAEREVRVRSVRHQTDVEALNLLLAGANRSRDRAQDEVTRLSRQIGWSPREKLALVFSVVAALAVGAIGGWALSKLP